MKYNLSGIFYTTQLASEKYLFLYIFSIMIRTLQIIQILWQNFYNNKFCNNFFNQIFKNPGDKLLFYLLPQEKDNVSKE